MDFIKQRVPKVKYVLTVCTGSGLLAKTGLLDGKKATTNKLVWNWMTSFGTNQTKILYLETRLNSKKFALII